jgi:pyruvate, orthophosphate dikinase
VSQLVFFFGAGKAEGHAGMKDVLGGKGANLAEMTNLGIPVPPGFTISTVACREYMRQGQRMPAALRPRVDAALKRLERLRGQRFGDVGNPLLVSVRSGAKFSMPGMMDTILNLGLNDHTVRGLAQSGEDPRFAWDSYRRFIQMYASVVLGVERSSFEARLEQAKHRRKVQLDTGLTAADLERVVAEFKRVVAAKTGHAFPQDPVAQLWGAIRAVFQSWNTDRARRYRREYGIPDDLGTAVNVQAMVFGNRGDDCATGVAFTRDPATGADLLYGEYLPNAQGEDVVAGIRTPLPIGKHQAKERARESLETRMPEAYASLQAIRRRLERHFGDMQDIEFTVERGKLYMLQTRTGKRTGPAALTIAFAFHRAGRIDRKEVVRRVEPAMLGQLLAPEFDPRALREARRAGRVLGRGLPAGPGAASGLVALSAERAQEWAARGSRVLLVRSETSPEDIGGMVAAVGILTSRGGITSHAAVVARGMGKPCVVGAEGLTVDERGGRVRARAHSIAEGQWLSIDGSTGEVIQGELQPVPSEIQRVLVERSLAPRRSALYGKFAQLMRWADTLRRLAIRTNADTPHDARVARAFGAEGIGLCRTEHMFFAEERIAAVRQMILAEDRAQRDRALARLLPMQRRDFVGIFQAMDGLPVTIRLLDPPLHEFLPTRRAQFRPLAKAIGVSTSELEARAAQLHESNPMLGHRGCRLGITFPEIYEMQVRAIFEAAVACRKRRIRVIPEVMIPLVGTLEEYRSLDGRIRAVADDVLRRARVRLPYTVGTMIEVPRACLVSGEIAGEAEFFSFGTNDLTQMVFGFSRDDVGKFLPEYLERRILTHDPFQSIDRAGVGRLVRQAVSEGRASRPRLKVGVCGEHGGDPASVQFFHEVGADYVSCSPFRVPVARLAAAHAVLAGATAGSGTH